MKIDKNSKIEFKKFKKSKIIKENSSQLVERILVQVLRSEGAEKLGYKNNLRNFKAAFG